MMSVSASTGTGYRLPVGTAVAHAYRMVIDNARPAVTLAWPPFAVIAAVSILGKILDGAGVFAHPWMGPARTIIYAIVYIVFGAVFAVRWYRFALLGERTPGPLFTPEWRAYLGVVLKLVVLAIVGWLAFGVIAGLIAISASPFLGLLLFALGTIAILFALLRVSLAFPAAAVGPPLSFRTAWDLLGGNFWRLFAAVVLCALPFSIGVSVLGWLGEAVLFPIALLFDVVWVAVDFAGNAVVVALVSEAYRRLVGPASGVIASAAA
jgi:hypothetical protein